MGTCKHCGTVDGRHAWDCMLSKCTCGLHLPHTGNCLDALEQAAPKPVSKRVCCRLCSCEGFDGTALCREHLEGYEYALRMLAHVPQARFAHQAALLALIWQPKEE